MTTVLIIAVGLSIFFAVLKLADSIRDIAFEIRETRRTMEHNAAKAQVFQQEYLQRFPRLSDPQATQSSLKEFLGEAPRAEMADKDSLGDVPDQAETSDLDRTDEFAEVRG